MLRMLMAAAHDVPSSWSKNPINSQPSDGEHDQGSPMICYWCRIFVGPNVETKSC
ncbi:hypothetical protein HanIR_Chr06g0286971 [Helianthus annuus]|nr:hypothetical protein HanIR_Chr06g0286971 [Helianthus annuus]